MLPIYKRIANYAAGAYLLSLGGFFATYNGKEGELTASDDALVTAILAVHVLSLFVAFAAYAKSKGYSGFIGFLLPLLSVVGLLILLRLKDKHPSGLAQNAHDKCSPLSTGGRIEPVLGDGSHPATPQTNPPPALPVDPAPKPKPRTPPDLIDYAKYVASPDFLRSYAWREVRMKALKLHGTRCQCCGATPADGRKMHVDHIKPRKHFPELALEIANLQVLCDECNHGKGNWDCTSWKDK